MLDTSSLRGASIPHIQPTGNRILIIIDAPITAPVIPSTISGLILMPFVSSSKNLKRPALEAGRGAFFFLLLIASNYAFGVKYIPLVILLGSLSFLKSKDISREALPFAFAWKCHSQPLFLMQSARPFLQLQIQPMSRVPIFRLAPPYLARPLLGYVLYSPRCHNLCR